MISYEQALQRVLAEASAPDSEEVLLDRIAGRVLAEDVVSEYDLPAFDNSAMDGYAVRCPVQGPLAVVGEIKAGDEASLVVELGTCVRIFTGAAIPAGANAVVMQERAERVGDRLAVPTDVQDGDYVRRRGEEFRRGEPVVTSGTLVSPAVVGCLAAAGVSSAKAFKKLKVSIVETGSELTQPGSPLPGGGVFAANGFALGAALESLNCEATKFGVSDDASATRDVFARALDEADLLITSGGVSVGDYDLVRPALANLGVEERFWRVAIRPGKPIYFGKGRKGAAVFGLPGNPGSALVTFLLFVRPYLIRCFGLTVPQWEVVHTDSVIEPSNQVETFMRVSVVGGRADPVAKQGSNMISSVASATHLLRIPAGDAPLPRGTPLQALSIAWSL